MKDEQSEINGILVVDPTIKELNTFMVAAKRIFIERHGIEDKDAKDLWE